MDNVFVAPQNFIHRDHSMLTVFLGGTIDNGSSEDWQAKASYLLSEDFNVLNPRRKDWNPAWDQSLENKEFVKQLEWETDGQDFADYIIYNFLPGSQSPITLLELGHYADTGKCLVICPKGFWRKGNVDFICERYGIQQFGTLDEAIDWLKEKGLKLFES